MTEGQNRVLVALTRDILPRTAENIGVEVNLKPASVRRTMAELRNIGFHIHNERNGQGYIYISKPARTSGCGGDTN